MLKVIIGIHGLQNKPPKRILEQWWYLAIKEGLKLNGYPPLNFKFKLVYWADLLYKTPLDTSIQDKRHPLYIQFPYVPCNRIVKKKPDIIRKAILDNLEVLLDQVFFTEKGFIDYQSISNMVIQHLFKDLETYYYKTCLNRKKKEQAAKEVMRNELLYMLKKYRFRKILLLAHSMGSIISYDALCLGTAKYKKIPEVNTFLTIGSPLGLPVIIKKHLEEHNLFKNMKQEVRTPEIVKQYWYNLSDLEDPIAINYNLGDDYKANSKGIKTVDYIVHNTYILKGQRDAHSDIGYLRTPEISKIIFQFLKPPKRNLWTSLSKAISRIFKISTL
jgi:hypothetical protein